MSFVAQTLEEYQARGVSLEVTRGHLIEVINKCDVKFTHSVSVVSRTMISIVSRGMNTRVELYQRLQLGLSGPTISYVGRIHEQEELICIGRQRYFGWEYDRQ